MIYLEDIIELIEDVPDELQRRGGLIQDWERKAVEYKKEADKLTARLHNDNTLRDDEKAHIYRKIGEMLDRARDVSEKKYEMAHKCHQLLQALSERVSDWSYHCKLELEVDAPGTTQAIESNFLNETMMVAAAAVNSRTQGSAAPAAPPPPAFRVPEEKLASRRDRVGSSSMTRESTPMFGAAAGAGPTRAEAGGGRTAAVYANSRTRDSSLSSSRSGSMAPYDPQAAATATTTTTQQQQRKRKRDRERERQQQYAAAVQQQLQARQQSQSASSSRAGSRGGSEVPVLKDPMSSYMRKKKEREREERKLREVHANRERSSQQRVIKAEPLDDGYETQLQYQQQQPPPRRAGPGRPPGSRTMNALLAAQQHQQQPQQQQLLQPRREEQQMQLQQPERREEQAQQGDNVNGGGMSDADDDDLLKFLHESMPDGIAPQDIHLGLEDENIFDFSTLGKDLGNEIGKIQSDRDPSPPPGHQNYYGTLNATTKASAAGPSRYNNSSDPRFAPTKADLKRQQARQAKQAAAAAAAALQEQQLQPAQSQLKFFGAGESLHGRQRKLTARAEIHAIDLDQKERKRRQKEEEMERGEYGRRDSRELSLGDETTLGGAEGNEEDSDSNLYCYCNMPSEGEMVGCDGKRCPYGGWFHLACLDMLTAPASDIWYCPTCRSSRQRR